MRKGAAGLVLALSFLACLAVVPALASDDDETSFFDYLPAAPDLKLPKIDIPKFWTSDLKIARKAYKNSDYGRALKYFNKSSEDGNVVADWYLGHMFRRGQGVAKDSAVAYSYYSRVAESYDADESDPDRLRIVVDSQVWLANYQLEGVPGAGIKANPQLAARQFLRLASNYGHPAAMFSLGVMNIDGKGVKKNPQQGMKWLMAAARKRHAEAEAYLGELYAEGRVVKPDETRALMWYLIATESESVEDHEQLSVRLNEMRDAASDDVRLEAEARARVWMDQYPIGGR
jgi:uncharacterized protein